jgi:hypothetical protein
MKPASTSQRQHKEQAAITHLMNTLKEINLNQSWKQNSSNFSKMKTQMMQNPQQQNLMTEQDLDQLFYNSKEKYKIKTETTECSKPTRLPSKRDFADIEFLRLNN